MRADHGRQLPCGRCGSVYLLALVATVVVSAVAMAMAQGVGQHLRGSQHAAARGDCRAAAVGLLRAIAADLDSAMAAGGAPALATIQADGETVGGVVVVLVGGAGADGRFRFGLVPEAGLVDVNHAPAAVLAALPGMDAARSAAISDWRDGDDTIDPQGGAERGDGAYAAATVPYAPRNAPFETLDELALVRDIDRDLWAGEDRNGNGMLDPGEDADHDGRLDRGLAGLCTLESREPANAPDGTPRTSCARAAGALRTRLAALFGKARATALAELAQRGQPFANRLDFLAALALSADEAARLWPYVICGEGRLGLVDAASAPEEVLVAAVGAEWAARLAGARPSTAQGPAWLVAALGREGAQAVGGRLTVGSYRFRADLLAVRRDGAGWDRLEAVLDCSTGTTRVLALRPAAARGWPLPWATPATLRRDPASDPRTLFAAGKP